MTENEMVGWHHQLNGHEFEQTLADSEGHGNLLCCSSWDQKELDMAEQQTTSQATWLQVFKLGFRLNFRLSLWGCRGWGWQAAGTWVLVSREMVGLPAPIR